MPCLVICVRAGPIVGVLGCMAERLKHKLLDVDQLADLVAGPDAYRDLPRLLTALQVLQILFCYSCTSCSVLLFSRNL